MRFLRNYVSTVSDAITGGVGGTSYYRAHTYLHIMRMHITGASERGSPPVVLGPLRLGGGVSGWSSAVVGTECAHVDERMGGGGK